MRAIAVWHSPAIRPGEPDYFYAVDATGNSESIFTTKASKRWVALARHTASLADKKTLERLAVVLRAAQSSCAHLVLCAVDAPNLPTVRLSACVNGTDKHIASVLMTQSEWAHIRARLLK